MPNNVIIAEGKTTNEAIENGLRELKATKSMVNIKVLESEDKRSFFSILAPRVVKVEMSLKEEITSQRDNSEERIKKEKKQVDSEILNISEKNIKAFLDDFIKSYNGDISYKINRNEYGFNISLEGKDSGYFIGYRGETLYAFQTIISSVANKGIEEKVRIVLDIENYKEKREETLRQLALKIARNVEKTKKSITLEPMQAYERKIIHSALQDSEKVQTVSVGEEPKRRVIISLK